MESAALLPAVSLLVLNRTLKLSRKPYLHLPIPPPATVSFGRARCFGPGFVPGRSRELFLISLAGNIIRCSSIPAPFSRPLVCFSSSTALPGPLGGGNDGVGGYGDDGGGGGEGNGGKEPVRLTMEAKDASSLGSDVIVLDVGGMSCGGCSANVKRILESLPKVHSATVNLATETAVVWAVPEAKVTLNWKQHLGNELANHLTVCGFKSSLRDSAKDSLYKVFELKMDEKLRKLKESGRDLAVAWSLCAVCFLGHLSHFIGANSSWVHMLHSNAFHFSLSLFTFLGPGRKLLVDGFKRLVLGSPNMNTLVGLGALSSFTVSAIAALIPKLGWKTFFEEPIMLMAFVLLGKNLEQRAKLKATSDMTGLLSILPTKANLVVESDGEQVAAHVEVPCSNLSIGDQIIVLPGDRIPVDGTVKAGRSTVDESSFTGEPLPVTKLPGAEVMAGSINLNGTLTIEVKRPGGETAMSDIIRLVENAQSREAPVQRLADKVAGQFVYGVMAFSASTFAFWSLFGSQILPAALKHGSAVSLALQLSCSVLVVIYHIPSDI